MNVHFFLSPGFSGWLALAGVAAVWLPALVPFGGGKARNNVVARFAQHAAELSCGLTIVSLCQGLFCRPVTCLLFSAGPLALSLRIDSLTAIVGLLVSFLSTVVIRFSRRYLEGDLRHAHFTKWLCLTCGFALLLVESSNLLLFAFAWSATSWSLHHLLVFYPDRPVALLAARGKSFCSAAWEMSSCWRCSSWCIASFKPGTFNPFLTQRTRCVPAVQT